MAEARGISAQEYTLVGDADGGSHTIEVYDRSAVGATGVPLAQWLAAGNTVDESVWVWLRANDWQPGRSPVSALVAPADQSLTALPAAWAWIAPSDPTG